MAKDRKQPRVRKGSKKAKQPVAHTPGGSVKDRHPVFSLRHADRTCEEAFGFCQDEATSHAVLDLMCEFSRSTWAELWAQTTGKRKRHHSQPISSIASEAQARIVELGLDEVIAEDLFRFRHGSTGRLWGFIVDDVFHVLWWDPDHRVYPTEPS